MARKKDRAFFVCPRWSELAGSEDETVLAKALDCNRRTIGKIAGQVPLAFATLRGVLSAIRGRSDITLDVDSYIVDTRSSAAK